MKKMDESNRIMIKKLDELGSCQVIIPDTQYWRDKWEANHQLYQEEVAKLNGKMISQEIEAWKKNKDFVIRY